jgi:DNA-binding FadR family transcriptional regulator
MAAVSTGRSNLSELVLQQLLEQLQRGAFKPGDRLPTERALMEQFDVGRSTIREALQTLARMNLVEARPGSGTVVKEPSVGAYLRPDVFAVLLGNSLAPELLEAREIVEVGMITLAAQRATPEDLAAIEQVLRAAEAAAAHDHPTYEFSAQFHIVVARAAHNTVLLNFMHSIYELLRARGQSSANVHEFVRWELASHRELFDFIRAGDVIGARHAMRAHLRHSAHQLDAPQPNMSPTAEEQLQAR